MKGQSIELEITAFSKKGHGVGQYCRQDGNEVFIEVPFTIPGDRVRAKILRKRSSIYVSLLEEVMTPSSNRIISRCAHFGSCGGCRWQQISYAQQLDEKEKLIEKAFGSLLDPSVERYSILPCDPPWSYRNKMEYTFSSNVAQEQFLGLIINASKGKVLNLTECHLVNPWFTTTLEAVRAWWKDSDLLSYHPYSNKGSLRTLTVREGVRTGDRMVFLTVSGDPDYALKRKHLDSFVSRLREAIEPKDGEGKLSLFMRIQQTKKGVPTQFYEMHLYGIDHICEQLSIQPDVSAPSVNLQFKISPTAFFQPCTRQAEKLYSRALQLAEISSDSVVYDLYCGTGTLGICAAKAAKQVVGVELSPESSLDARTNAADNQLENITIFTGDVGQVLTKIRDEGEVSLPDIVLVDPPRMGLDDRALRHLIELGAKTVVYISCNPLSQAQNIETLVKEGYQLKTLQPVDQFPHTVHVENIAVLKI